ncbi:hypothetical protein KFU94_27680 [Chloroflexi bacterium TSY]|nr:hypothetical protein [Chloroflexi bacterium TSY]
MTRFNRFVVMLLWLLLLFLFCYVAATPLQALAQGQRGLAALSSLISRWREADPTNFVIGQSAFIIVVIALFGTLIWLEILASRRRGVRIRTAEGGSAELETDSIGRRLAWHLDQVAEIITVVPVIKAKGSAVDVKLEIEAAPDVDVPMKTDEVVEVTRDIVEQDMGLRLGKLDVHMRCAPFEPEWT